MDDEDNKDEEGRQIMVHYHRRTDRSPEKNFEEIADENKLLFCNVRSATERAFLKITKLNDEINDRERVIEKERELRLVAEEKLKKYLKDPYDNPEVNKELRQRLPRANTTDPLLESPPPTGDPGQDDGQDVTEDVMEKQTVKTSQRGVEIKSQVRENLQLTGNESLSLPNAESGANHPIPKTDIATMNISAAASQPRFVVGSQLRTLYNPITSDPSMLSQSNFEFGRYGSAFTPRPVYINPTLNGILPQGSVQMPSYSYNLGTVPENLRAMSFTTGGESQAEVHTSLNTQNASLSTSESGDGKIENNTESDTKCDKTETSKLPTERRVAWDIPQAGAISFPRNPVLPQNQPLFQYQPPMYSQGLGNFNSRLTVSSNPSDQAKQVSLLLTELDAAKAQSKQLAGKLIETERELENARIKLKMESMEQKDKSESLLAANLVQDVHEAQRKREESMMGRLKIAIQERDEAVYRLRELEQKLDEGYSETDRSDSDELQEEDLDEKLDHMMQRFDHSDTMLGFDRECSSLIRKVERFKERQREITLEEMQALIDDRDRALARASKLEAELLYQQQMNTGKVNNEEQHTKARMACLEQERDMALAQVRQLKDEIQTIRIYYSLHKSLSQECLLRDQVNNTLHTYKSKVADDSSHNNILTAQLRDVTSERDQLARDLQKREADAEESRIEKEKLKKLVGLLRKKVKGYVDKPGKSSDHTLSS